MSKKYKRGIYIFTRDLRIYDNELLSRAALECTEVYPIFVFNHEQVGKKNKYLNKRAIKFMCECLQELKKDIPITFFDGNYHLLAQIENVDAIYINLDATPYATKRVNTIKKLFPNTELILGRDIFLGRHSDLFKKDGTPYMIYSPFSKYANPLVRKEEVIPKVSIKNMRQYKDGSHNIIDKYLDKKITNRFVGGRKEGLRHLNTFCKANDNYKKSRDLPHLDNTSHISAYLHNGVLGPVEVMHMFLDKLSRPVDIINQLIWREFYLYIIWKSHTSYDKKSRTLPKRNKIKWQNSMAKFKLWCDAETGIPWIDAAMTELNTTGYMQNRLRMNVAMFLIFYYKIDWTWGEQYFAQNLVDYDMCNNLGGWLWSAAWEVHSNDLTRTFSMKSQMKRFDPDAQYVKKWLPQFKDVPAVDIYDWPQNYKKYKIKYPTPSILNMDDARKDGMALYKN